MLDLNTQRDEAALARDRMAMDGAFLPDDEAVDEAEQLAQKQYEARQLLGSGLAMQAQEQVAKRRVIEDRWILDLQQYNGVYPPEKLQEIINAGGSQAFVNVTRPKADTFSARMADMIAPTDGANFGIKPTPVPELVQAKTDDSPLVTPAGKAVVTDQGHPVLAKDMAAGIEKAAEDACDLMMTEMTDQLAEAGYNPVQRDIIDDTAIYGTGILKGPVIVGKTRKAWMRGDGGYTLHTVEETKPGAMRVSPWDFFPDMSATRIKDCEFIFERHYMTRRQLRDLLKTPGFDKRAVREVLESTSKPVNTASHLNRIRAISGLQSVEDNRYEVWEYHGPIDKDDLASMGVKVDEDALTEYEGVVWFCQNVVLKAVINPMDTGDRPYSACYCAKDDSSIFGYGYPWLLRASQAVANASWRMVIDNAGLSVGPQIVIDRTKVVPLDGDPKLKPRKTWDKIGEGSIKECFEAFSIDSHMTELMEIFNVAVRLSDEETNLSQIAQGNQGNATQTAQGMTILMNAANVVLRRAVKSYDDDITLTFIPRLYDWNMQFNSRDDIKGDYNVVALGSSVLMEKESQTQALLQAANLFQNPELGEWIDDEKYVTAVFKNQRTDSVLRTKDEVQKRRDDRAKQAAAAAQGPPQPAQQPPDPAINQLKAAELQLKYETLKVSMAEQERADHIKVMQLAQKDKISEQEARVTLGLKKMEIDADTKAMMSEIAVKYRMGSGI